MKIIDVSLKINEETIVYPGNPAPRIERYREVPGDSTTESKIEMGSHTGTHVDAPMHVFEDGKPVSEMDLESFYGECQVLDLTDAGPEITADDLEDKELDARIVLLKTENSEMQYDEFRRDFAHITLPGVEYLMENGVKTLGMDYLSIAEFDEGEEAHRKAIKEMTVFEGLDLRNAEEGRYTFSGFPLKMDTDGAPARAVLIERDQ